MVKPLASVRFGLALVLLGLCFGIGMGVMFGVNEEAFQSHIAAGIAAHPEVNDAASKNAIWRYAQRAHFHATGIGAFSLGLVLLAAFSGMHPRWKKITSTLIGLGACYPLSWFTMFYIAPEIGRKAAHQYWLVELFTYIGVGGLLLGLAPLLANLFLHALEEPPLN